MMRPNFVVIMADDMGFSDLGCFGSEIRTPNLDQLATDGLRLTQMYNNARCCPTRASLLTGLYPHQAGIGHMVTDLGALSYQGYLNDSCVTIAEALRLAGYRTLMSGKWHVGGSYLIGEEWSPGAPGYPRPVDRGFDQHYGTLTGHGSYFYPHTLVKNETFVQPDEDFYYTDAITDEAVAMIDAAVRDEQPFLLYIAHVAPHWPLHAVAEDIDRYRTTYREGWEVLRARRHRRLQSLELIDADWPISPRDEFCPPWSTTPHKDWESARMAVYAAQVDRTDQGVGRVVSKLRDTGSLDDTLVIFLSDNGGCAELLAEDGPQQAGPGLLYHRTPDGRAVRAGNSPDVWPGSDDTFMSYGLPWANASNSPFRLFKHWVHEGGISTPFIAHWPAVIGAGRITHEPVHVTDVMATLLDLSAATYPAMYEGRKVFPLEGESFAPLLRGKEWSRTNPICWEHEGNRAVRQGRWKLVSKYPGGWELYDMERDRTETVDLSRQHPAQAAEMAAVYFRWAERVGVTDWDELRAIAPV